MTRRRGGLFPRQRRSTASCRAPSGTRSRAASSRNTERLLDALRRARRARTFFVLGWVAERLPDAGARASPRPATRSRRTATLIGWSTTRRRRQFREDVRRAKALLEDSGGRAGAGYRAPSYSITPRSLWALDVLIEEGYSYDASIFPIHHDRYGISGVAAACLYRLQRQAGTWSKRRRRRTVGPAEPADRRRRLFPHPAVRVDAVGHRAGQPPRAAAGDLLPAPVGDRSGSAAAVGQPTEQVPPLPQSRSNRSRLRRLLADYKIGTMRWACSRTWVESRRQCRPASCCRTSGSMILHA